MSITRCTDQGSPQTQRHGSSGGGEWREREGGVYGKEWVPVTVEAEMSHVRTSAYRPRKAGDVFLARACWSENPRVADLSCSPGQEKPLSQLK